MPRQGVRHTDHIGLTVPDLEEAVSFLQDLLGASELYRVGPFEADDDWMQRHLGVHPRAKIRQLAVLRLGTGPDLELFEFDAPDQRPFAPRNSDVGAAHLAFYVDDINTAESELRARGLTLLGETTTMVEGPSAGLSWIYFLSPWGLQLELVSAPKGLAYERSAPR